MAGPAPWLWATTGPLGRGYVSPAGFLNDYTYRDPHGRWRTSRAITMALFQRDNAQVAEFGATVNATLEGETDGD